MASQYNHDYSTLKQFITIKGARVHNLKSVDVQIRRNHLVVVTGLSGSGKSSLAFDTLYNEGQRRYVESLSSYARQFLGRMHKPEVDYIEGISPAIAIEQRVNTRNPRSTVGTSTEVYDYLKLLFARVGKTISPISGQQVKRHTVTDVVDLVMGLPEGSMAMILAPITVQGSRTLEQHLSILLQQGFTKVGLNQKVYRIEEVLENGFEAGNGNNPCVIVDRLQVRANDQELMSRVADSVQTAFHEGSGVCLVRYEQEEQMKSHTFSSKFELDGLVFEEPSVNFFTFNNPYGACKTCEGFGSVLGIDPDLVIPNKSLSIFEGAIVCWKGEKMGLWNEDLVNNAYKFDFPVHRPYHHLTQEQKDLLWSGNEYFGGLDDFFKMVEENTYKIQYRVMLSRYRGKRTCPDCLGTRLRKDASYVKVGRKSIADLALMPMGQLKEFFANLQLEPYESEIARRLLIEINNRLSFLTEVGLGYLTLNRLSNTLSGGESQRINLATSLGSNLVGSMYILDEPSIGLHPRDTRRLIEVLKKLRDLGNTVIVVEHEEEMMRAADQVIDIGPLAGSHGGEIVFQGTFNDLVNHNTSLTSAYLSGKMAIETPKVRRKWKEYVILKGVRQHNLKGFDVKIPLKVLTVVTGVSGSGKTTLVRSILYPALKKIHGGIGIPTGKFDSIEGDINSISEIEYVDQNPIGKSSRSNPVTYIKAYDEIRTLYSNLPLAKTRGYTPAFFSFNIDGGRCPECEGDGFVKIEMQFMADITLTCDSCKGKRFREDILDVVFAGKTITDILDLTVDDAIAFFDKQPNQACKRISARLQPLADVGLGYIKLGQSSSTLSGGEAQRVKLASFLTKGFTSSKTLFIFDEPTTGLHFHDINKLLQSFNALIDKGHSILVIEHNPDVIKCADWVLDLGPEGGEKGGEIVFEGVPENLANCVESYTGQFLKTKI